MVTQQQQQVVEFVKKDNNCGNIQATPRDLLCDWVGRAWDTTDPVIVKMSFLKCGMSNAPDGEEDDWWRKDCDDVPDETVDNELDPYDDALADADMLELFNSNSEDGETLS